MPQQVYDKIKGRKTPDWLQVRVPGDMIERIDDLRGLVPREAYIREMLDEVVSERERFNRKRRVKRKPPVKTTVKRRRA
jgi:hypothetical protein